VLHILAAILGLSLLVIVHEAGHYLMARAFGIRVTRFNEVDPSDPGDTRGASGLLPLPGLDGGKRVFLGYEIITRHRPSERMEGAIHALGLLLLVTMIALVTFRDVVS